MPRRSLQILLVQSEPAVSQLLSTRLAARGHVVFCADSLAGAWADAGRLPNPFDIVITGHRFADGTGVELVTELQAGQKPARQVIVYTTLELLMPEDMAAYKAAKVGFFVAKGHEDPIQTIDLVEGILE